MPVIVPVICVFILISAIVYFLTEATTKRAPTARERLDTITGRFAAEDMAAAAATPEPVSTQATHSQGTYISSSKKRDDSVPLLTKLVSTTELGKTLRLEMVRAGLRLRPSEFVAICLASTMGTFLIGIFLTNMLLISIVLGIIGMMIPIFVLKTKQKQRLDKFNSQITDILALISSSLRTGYSFMNSMQMIITEVPAPASEEFAWVLGETTLGVPMEVSLQRMVDRIKSYDFDLVVTAVTIQLQVGGNLAEVLDTIAETIRERGRIKSEINSLTAEGRLSGIILMAMPIVLAGFLTLRQHDYFKPLLDDPSGIPIIAVGLIAQIVGGLIIRKMVAIEV